MNNTRNGNIKMTDLTERIKLIDGSNTDYISENGNVYKMMKNNELYKKKTRVNESNGYVYCGITFNNGKNKQKRIHRLVAAAFVENKNKDMFRIVGHKDNIKHNNVYTNLYWTDTSENTKKAFDDGLVKNDKGIEDNQSIHIAMYKNNGDLISVYGSIIEAGKKIKGSSKSSISKVVDKTTKGRKGYYFKSISKDEYYNTPINKRELEYTIPYIKKNKINFKVTSPNGDIITTDNQKEIERTIGISQGRISQLLRKKKHGYLDDYYFEKIN